MGKMIGTVLPGLASELQAALVSTVWILMTQVNVPSRFS